MDVNIALQTLNLPEKQNYIVLHTSICYTLWFIYTLSHTPRGPSTTNITVGCTLFDQDHTGLTSSHIHISTSPSDNGAVSLRCFLVYQEKAGRWSGFWQQCVECGILSALPPGRAEWISPYIAARSEQLPALDAMPGSLRERKQRERKRGRLFY